MLIEWVNLGKLDFLNWTGKRFLRVWGKYLILAIMNYPHKEETKLGTSRLKSSTWRSLNKWLQFQIRFINPRDWARTPVILEVAGGYSRKNDLFVFKR